MARQRWTFTLILVCSLPILATVITAFRVRDLPTRFPERTNDKCEDCDSDSESKLNRKLHDVKLDSAASKRYEELKKAVREKQQEINSKKLAEKGEKSPTQLLRVIDDDDDDDDDEDEAIIVVDKGKPGSKLPIVPQVGALKSKLISTSIKLNIGYDADDDDDDDDSDDDDDDDDDEDDENDDSSNIKNIIKTKQNLASKDIVSKHDKSNKDDEKNQSDKVKKLIPKTNKVINKNSKDTNVNDDDSDDDDDDDDDVGDIFVKVTEKKETTKAKGSDAVVKMTEKKTTPKVKGPIEIIKPETKKADIKDDGVKNASKKVEKSPTHTPNINVPKKESSTKEVKSVIEQKEKTVQIQQDTKSKQKEVEANDKIKPKVEPLKGDNAKDKPQLTKAEDKKHKEPEPKKKEEPKLKENSKKEQEPTKKESVPKEKTAVKRSDESEHKKDKHHHSSKEVEDIEIQMVKPDNNIKNINEVLNRRNLLQSEFEDFYAFLPTFAPNFSRIHNPECRRHGQILLRQLRGSRLWALNMLDATAKVPSGVLQGNGIQLGDFDQCLGSRARVQLDTGSVVRVQGKYCLALVDVRADHPELELPVYLAQAKNLIKSRVDDPGHFVPRFSTLSWGVCVPDACEAADVELVVRDAVKHYQHTSGVVVRVKVHETDCRTQNSEDWWETWLELPTVLTLSFYSVVVLLVLLATTQDYLSQRKSNQTEDADDKAECDQKDASDEAEDGGGDGKSENEAESSKCQESLLGCFSLYRSVSKLVSPSSADEIPCIHGVRAFSTLALLLGHKFLPLASAPYTNRLKLTEVASSAWWSWCRAGWVFTDCFLLLSGTLTAHRLSSDSDSSAPRRLLSRYIRLSPALMAVVLFYAFVWDKLSTGPMWGALVTRNAELCQTGWWWNMLYVQNYFNFEDMCAPQTHQLALDMQLSVLAGAVVWFLNAKPAAAWAFFPAAHAIAAYSRYTTVSEHRLTMIAYHGVSVSQLYRTARLSYLSILHRSTPYLVGISLGLALQKNTKHNKVLVALGWISSGTLWCLVWWSGYDAGYTQYRYNAAFAAQYAALVPIAAAVAIAWLIYAVHTGHCAEFLSRLLCSRFLILVSRLSYAVYLCQFIVFLTNAATVRTSREFTFMSLVDVQEISAIVLSSVILTLTLVIPIQSIPKFILPSKREEEQTTQEENAPTKEQVEEEIRETFDTYDELEGEVDEIILIPQRGRQILAHHEILEEIPEVEVEYEQQRDRKDDYLEEILEEEEDEIEEEEAALQEEEEMEIIEGEEAGGEDDFWGDREEDYVPRRSHSVDNHQDMDDWELTANSQNGAQNYYRR